MAMKKQLLTAGGWLDMRILTSTALWHGDDLFVPIELTGQIRLEKINVSMNALVLVGMDNQRVKSITIARLLPKTLKPRHHEAFKALIDEPIKTLPDATWAEVRQITPHLETVELRVEIAVMEMRAGEFPSCGEQQFDTTRELPVGYDLDVINAPLYIDLLSEAALAFPDAKIIGIWRIVRR